jgi:plasmid stabilization system protein ParE
VTLPVAWTPEANEDLLEARAWYDNIRPELGERFALAVEATIKAIAEHPLQFPVVYRNRRRAGVRRFPYSIFLEFSGAPDCGHRLLPQQTRSETLAIAVAAERSAHPFSPL